MDSVNANPHPSLDEGKTVTSAKLYKTFIDSADILSVENKTLGSSPNNISLTANKSVPLSSTGCVCNNRATLSFLSSGNWSLNNLNATNKSDIHFLLIFLELKKNICSYSLPPNNFFFVFKKSSQCLSPSLIGLKTSSFIP